MLIGGGALDRCHSWGESVGNADILDHYDGLYAYVAQFPFGGRMELLSTGRDASEF